MTTSDNFNKLYDEIKAKYLSEPDNSKDRQKLAQEIGQAFVDALIKAEKEEAAANDPENIWRESLDRLYGETPKRQEPELTPTQKAHIAMQAWRDGERWESPSPYASMDYDAMMKAREEK